MLHIIYKCIIIDTALMNLLLNLYIAVPQSSCEKIFQSGMKDIGFYIHVLFFPFCLYELIIFRYLSLDGQLIFLRMLF